MHYVKSFFKAFCQFPKNFIENRLHILPSCSCYFEIYEVVA